MLEQFKSTTDRLARIFKGSRYKWKAKADARQKRLRLKWTPLSRQKSPEFELYILRYTQLLGAAPPFDKLRTDGTGGKTSQGGINIDRNCLMRASRLNLSDDRPMIRVL